MIHVTVDVKVSYNIIPGSCTRLYHCGIYHMTGNFYGVLIFIIFVVDLVVTKFSYP